VELKNEVRMIKKAEAPQPCQADVVLKSREMRKPW
jgi:hypothetical protein